AISEWVELGQLYPPAREALIAVRDRKAATIREGNGSPNLFADVAAINHRLGQDADTIALFTFIHRSDPRLAADCYSDAEEGLAANGEYAVCIGYIPDPLARFERIREFRRRMLTHGAELADQGFARDSGELADRGFARDVRTLIDILVGVGQLEQA